jgi:hypothetical protein
MKIILSRKGFDSSSGGIPSPIFPDGTLFSLPIPGVGEPTTYAQIDAFDHSVADILCDLRPCGYRRKGAAGSRPWAEVPAHLDPDLRIGSLPRDADWRPLFGQDGPAQTHLENQGVGPGDVFLFFGLFRRTRRGGSTLRYVRNAPRMHVIFGWLEVGEVWPVHQLDHVPACAHAHPHLTTDCGPNNTIYAAATIPDERATQQWRGGAFRHFDTRLQLSESGALSTWRLPAWFYPTDGKAPLTYHGDPARWDLYDNHVLLETVGRGQEFVLDTADYPEAETWVEEILTLPTA